MAVSEVPVVSVLLFLAGIGAVLWSVEEFVEHVADAAMDIGVSAFLLTVVLAGTDLENAVLGVAAALGELPRVALGTVFGEALFILGAAVGLAGLLAPFEVETPHRYLALTAVSLAPFLLLGVDGSLSRLDGLVLLVAFVPPIWVIHRWEADHRIVYFEAEDEVFDEDGDADGDAERRPLVELGIVAVAIVGMTVGSELAVIGAYGVLNEFELGGLAFGATVMSFVASLEEILLTVEPVREGRPEIGVGNVVGSVLFFVTANVGAIALVHPLSLADSVFVVHWPFFVVSLALVVTFLYRGRVGRPEGLFLLCVYGGYWLANYV